MRTPVAVGLFVLVTSVALSACGSEETPNELAASSEFGEKPELTVPGGDPPTELVVDVLSEGDGAEVESGDLLVVNYLGQTWEPRLPDDIPSESTESEGEGDARASDEAVPFVFDSSYDQEQPAVFEVGVGSLIPAWDEGLIGQYEGSRLLLTVPPEQGYGSQQGHDLAEDTLLFVVDIIGAFNAGMSISGDPVADVAEDLPTVTGEDTGEPTVEFPAEAEAVTESTSDLLIAGDGPDIRDNIIVKVLEASYTTGDTNFSSWAENRVFAITLDQLPGMADALNGQKVGSRVLVRIAADDNAAEENPDGEPIAIVIDVIGSF